MDTLKVIVKFAQDPDANVWYVLESTVPGLHVEADSFEEMVETLEECIPELLIANGLMTRKKRQSSVPWELVMDRQLQMSAAC